MFIRCLKWAVLGAGLTGCTVYAPMQPTVSTVREAGQVEISGSSQLNGRLEGGVVLSPVAHVLLAGAGSYRPAVYIGKTYFSTRQWEAAAGTYWALGPKWLLTGLGGYGYASSGRIWAELLGGTTPDLHARYGKWFGQAGLHHDGQNVGFGLVYRLTELRFDELSYYTPYYAGIVDMRPLVRHELLFYSRRLLGGGPVGQWHMQTALGVSLAARSRSSDDTSNRFEYNRTLFPALLASVGVVFSPAWRLGRAR